MNGIGLLRREYDADEETDREILRDSKTRYSQSQIIKRNIRWTIVGDRPPSRKKVFSEIQTSTDLKLWNVEAGHATILCAKVCNPRLLEKNSGHWDQIVGVERLEIEDPEGLMTNVPKHLISEMRHLQSISITWSRIKSLPDALFEMPLRTLHLSRNQLTTLSGIHRAKQLTTLDLSSNRIESLPKGFDRLSNLMTLNLSGNELKELPDDIVSLSRLKSFECSTNKLKSLPDSIGNMLELTMLDICNNQLTSFPETIGNLPSLEDLRARGNQLRSLPRSFGRLARLKSLTLMKNLFQEVPTVLGDLSCLQSLNMKENSIATMERPISSLQILVLDDNILTQIANGILTSFHLQQLSIQTNRITRVPEEICNLRNLRSLVLSGNDIHDLPSSVSDLQELRHLGVGSTPISRLPVELAYLKNLKHIDIDDCPELPAKFHNKGLTGILEALLEQLPVERRDEVLRDHPLRNLAGQSLYPYQPIEEEAQLLRERTNMSSRIRRFTAGKTIFPDQLPDMRKDEETEMMVLRKPEDEVEYATVQRREVRRLAGQTLDVPFQIQPMPLDPLTRSSQWPGGQSSGNESRSLRNIAGQSIYPSDN